MRHRSCTIPWVQTTQPFLPCVCGENEQRPWLRTVRKEHPEPTSSSRPFGDATQLGRTSAANDCEGVKAKPLASRGAHHFMCPIFHSCGCRPTRSEKTHAVSTHAVRITACVPFSCWPTRSEKTHARSLPSLARWHMRHLWGVSPASLPLCSISPGCLPLSHFSLNPIRQKMATFINKLQILTAQQFIVRALHRGQSLWSRKIFKMATASATVRCFRRLSQWHAGLSPRSCRSCLASSGGLSSVLVRHLCVDTGLRTYRAHCSTVQDPACHFLGDPVLIPMFLKIKDSLGDVGREPDRDTATTKIIPMPITTANDDRKQPTANQTILWFCDTKKQSPTAASVAHGFLRPEKTRKKQNSFASHLSHKTPRRKNTLHSTNQKTQCGGSYFERSTKQGRLRHCLSDRCWIAKTFGGRKKPTWMLSCWKMNRSEKTQSAAFTYGPGDQTRVPSRHGNLGGDCVWRTEFHNLTARRHTTNSSIRAYTTIMLTEISVPLASPVASTVPRNGLPKLFLTNSRDMRKCNWDTVKNEASLRDLLNV